jgi:hypothetical protein
LKYIENGIFIKKTIQLNEKEIPFLFDPPIGVFGDIWLSQC